VALGGNALLERGEEPTAENQVHNVIYGCRRRSLQAAGRQPPCSHART